MSNKRYLNDTRFICEKDLPAFKDQNKTVEAEEN